MSGVERKVISSNPVARVGQLLLAPSREWERIEAEPATILGLYLRHVGLLAAIPPTAKVLGFHYLGRGLIPLGPTIAGAVTQYLLSLVAVFVLALWIDGLAPSFDGRRDRVRAFKVAAYGGTGYWVLGVLAAFPVLGIAGGLVSARLYFLGLPKLMKAPREKAFVYMIGTAGGAFALFLAISPVANLVAGQVMAYGDRLVQNRPVGPESMTFEELTAIEKNMEARFLEHSDASAPPPAIRGLSALLPADVGSYARTGTESEWDDAAGTATYRSDYVWGASRFTLTIKDLGARSGQAGLSKVVNQPSLRETASGYERAEKSGDRLMAEEWNAVKKSGRSRVIIADRFQVEASGEGSGIDVLRRAVNAVDARRLEELANLNRP
jgi:hypothetical protein